MKVNIAILGLGTVGYGVYDIVSKTISRVEDDASIYEEGKYHKDVAKCHHHHHDEEHECHDHLIYQIKKL